MKAGQRKRWKEGRPDIAGGDFRKMMKMKMRQRNGRKKMRGQGKNGRRQSPQGEKKKKNERRQNAA
jgi:hypothetical protein